MVRAAGVAISSVALTVALAPASAFAQANTTLVAWNDLGANSTFAQLAVVQVAAQSLDALENGLQVNASGQNEEQPAIDESEEATQADDASSEGAESEGAPTENELSDEDAAAEASEQPDDPEAASANESADAAGQTAETKSGKASSRLSTMADAEEVQQKAQEADSDSSSGVEISDDEASEAESNKTLTAQADGDGVESSSDSAASDASEGVNAQADSDLPAHSLVWAYTTSEAQALGNESAILEHGTAEVVNVKLATGTTVDLAMLKTNASTSTEPYFKTASSSSSSSSMTSSTDSSAASSTTTSTSSSSSTGGILVAPAGSTVTVKILPARGYQLASPKAAGGSVTLTPSSSSETGYYTFEMPEEANALGCSFSSIADEVDINSEAIADGEISEATGAVENGTLLLTIDDLSDATMKTQLATQAKSLGKSASGSAIADADIVGCVNMSLSNVIFKGDSSVSWETPLTDLPSAITLKLMLTDSAAGTATQFFVVREHNGQYAAAPTTYNSSDKSIQFNCSGFSNFAIVKGVPSSSSDSTTPTNPTTPTNTTTPTNQNTSDGGKATTTPKTGDTTNTVPLTALAGVSAVAALYSLRRIRRTNTK